ncbi:type 1 periplasmic binding fold superfamily protein [Zobellia alginiliquefaciens]|uniref:type 1 periplasmic binding fold superfamily protein n=1 Tax=Zobellia alginiliquefaciens TaxID=3032586 RepID=UPI0023E3AA76|nr:type 1 periplasmic binding fold superfamily protein [Zobellia alginiliquefaciens]
MKKIKLLTALLVAGTLFVSCSDDDDNTPEIVNEEELITTVTVTLAPEGNGDDITLQLQDLDGDGSDKPVYTVSGSLAANMVYDGSIVLWNETESPAENITEEVEEEGDEHQFFYSVGTGLDLTTEYADLDEDGNPIGIEFTVTTGEASTGTLTFTLRHEPSKPNDGSLADAGGETDVEASFDIEIE